jgi:hypothetical protein
MSISSFRQSRQKLEAARTLFSWLAVANIPQDAKCDAVIGFGHFDLNIPRRCGQLQQSGAARHIIFTGGIGAGTADLGEPEANAFLAELTKEYPTTSPIQVIIENRSTNTGENIRFTRDLLEGSYADLAFGQGIHSVLLVANPCRQRRVWLTWRQLLPSIPAYNAPATGTLEQQELLFASKGQNVISQLLGEFERIRDYPARGWITASPIPNEVTDAATVLA